MVSMYSANARHTRNRSTAYSRFLPNSFTPFHKGVANRLLYNSVLLSPSYHTVQRLSISAARLGGFLPLFFPVPLDNIDVRYYTVPSNNDIRY